jgi:glycosyltransferase involved in cell wall biosynthesis
MHFEHDALAVRRLRSDLRQLRLLLRSVDAVHTHASWDTWLVAWARASLGSRPPMVRTRHNLKRIRSHGFNRWLYSRALTRLVAASHTIASDLARHAWIPQERVETIVDGIDLVAFDPRRHPRAEARSALRRRLGAPEDAPVVVYASRLSPRKRPELFVEAARRLGVAGSDAWFALAGPFAGDRAWRDSLSRSVESLGPRVQCLGFVEDVPGLLAGCDLFVLPADAEPFGLAAVEAMAMGCPPVCPRAGGLAESIVDGETGLLFAPGDVAACADAIQSLLHDDELRRRLAANGPPHVARHFDRRRMTSDYLDLYARLRDARESPAA